MDNRRPLQLYLLLFLQLILGTGAFYGSWKLLTDPMGFGMNPEWLAGTPFKSYVIPGLILLVCNGLFPLLIVWGLIARPQTGPWGALNIYSDRHWAWTYSLFSGIMLIGWITVQLMMVPSFWLQPTFLVVGLLILILTLTPGVMRYYLVKN
ncbi:MAG: hypothetical protein JNJ57_03640 [Saprospiraceae bacterium]|nr:hypothetical protein [Saprospiraceae bacterium]